jgi:hypothetical protein
MVERPPGWRSGPGCCAGPLTQVVLHVPHVPRPRADLRRLHAPAVVGRGDAAPRARLLPALRAVADLLLLAARAARRSALDAARSGRARRAPDGEEQMTDEALARLFHDTYERLAPEFGYETREASRKPWEEVPQQNRTLMVAVAGVIAETLGLRGDVLDRLDRFADEADARSRSPATPGTSPRCGGRPRPCGPGSAGLRYGPAEFDPGRRSRVRDRHRRPARSPRQSRTPVRELRSGNGRAAVGGRRLQGAGLGAVRPGGRDLRPQPQREENRDDQGPRRAARPRPVRSAAIVIPMDAQMVLADA